MSTLQAAQICILNAYKGRLTALYCHFMALSGPQRTDVVLELMQKIEWDNPVLIPKGYSPRAVPEDPEILANGALIQKYQCLFDQLEEICLGHPLVSAAVFRETMESLDSQEPPKRRTRREKNEDTDIYKDVQEERCSPMPFDLAEQARIHGEQ